MNKVVTESESKSVTAHGIFNTTVADSVAVKNIPYFGNCKGLPHNETEIKKIRDIHKKVNKGKSIREEGICKQLMNLEKNWENYALGESFFTFYDDEKDKQSGITMTSILFCKHGGFIYPVTSGQSMTMKSVSVLGKEAGYLAYGCSGITQDASKGYFKLYDGPTVDGSGDRYSFADIYKQCGSEGEGALQGFGGLGCGLNTKNGTIRYEGQENYSTNQGILSHNGIDRYTVAIGPALQNPNYTLDEWGKLKAEEMAYGTCIDIVIELEDKKYYIPAVIVDVKAHSAPNGYCQTGNEFGGKDLGGVQGNIVEWYVVQGEGTENKSVGLYQFDQKGEIIIYRHETLAETTE